MRRASKRLCVLLALALATLAARPAAARKYTLDDLLSTVRADYPGLVAGREGVAAARLALSTSQHAWVPTGDLQFTLSGTPNVRCLSSPSDTGGESQKARESNCLDTNIVDLRSGPSASLANVAPIHGVQTNLTLTLNQPIYSFGRFEANIAIAKANVATAEANLAREEIEVVFNATRAYWGVKSAKAAVATLTEARDKLHEWLQRFDREMNGANPSHLTEGDLARLKLAQANIEVLLLDQERNRAFAVHALQALTRDGEADVDDEEIDLAGDAPEELTAWQARALAKRPELRLARAASDTARATRRLRIAEMLPEVAINANFGYGYASAMDTPQNWFMSRPSYLNANLSLWIHQPLDFGVKAGRYLQAEHEAKQKAALIESTTAVFASDLAQAHANYEEARARVDETARGEKVARGWFTSIDQSANTGLTTNSFEMVEAARNYFEFRLRHLQALFDANLALASLRRAAGEGVPAPTMKATAP